MLKLPPGIASLPIAGCLPALVTALQSSPNAVLSAPPGTGKSTGVPLALVQAPWCHGTVLMLEPRRLAARAVASRMASLLGEQLGQTIGLRTRLETRESDATRVEVVTEGVLTRMLQSDVALEGISVVVFDEFHERSLQADLGLALSLDCQSQLRGDLRLLVMSATLDADPVAAMMGTARVFRSEATLHPVTLHHQPRPERAELARAVATTVRRALAETPGDLLVFLPGAPEIRKVERLLAPDCDARVLPLYGDLPLARQDAALARLPGGRKVVLATAIAETSLTIDGIGTVIDAGWARRSRLDSATGMTGLVTRRVSQAAATQRAGRAGRQGPGHCYRLWPESETARLEEHAPAEITEADLAPLALELARWGSPDASGLRFLDPPPPASLAQARALLSDLGALDATGQLTALGRQMAAFGTHPRLAKLLLTARDCGAGLLGSQLVAVLEERDFLRGSGSASDPDLRLRLDLLRQGDPGGRADAGVLARVRNQARRWQRRLGAGPGTAGPDDAGALLAQAYPDRIGQARGGGGRYLLSGGRGARLRDAPSLARSGFLAIATLDAASGEREAIIHLAAPLSREALEQCLAQRIEWHSQLGFDPKARRVIARRQRRLGALVLADEPWDDAPRDELMTCLLEGLQAQGQACLPWTPAARELQARVAFLRHHLGGEREAWPALDDAALMAELPGWLPPWLVRADTLEGLDLEAALLARLDRDARRRLEALAPTHVEVPSGSRIRIDYGDIEAPTLAVRLQEMFGAAEGPRLAGGRVPVALSLLSPARRPVQVTRDLASFWRGSYAEVRKEMRGRYPKHHWPEDPASATATRRLRPRGP